MFVVFDKFKNEIGKDGHGHFKVYSKRSSAHRKAENENRSVYPKIDRWEARPVSVVLTGSPVCDNIGFFSEQA